MSATATSDAKPQAFPHTRWTIVLTAGRSDTPRTQAALAELCQAYWYPLYAYVRRRGHSAADAEDLTQGFFARLLQLDSLAAVQREKGKFRSFLLGALNHYLADQWDRASAAKRDVRVTLPLDTETAETRYARAPANTDTPERLFERQWALTLLETVVQRLHREYADAGKGDLFLALRFAISGDKNAVPYTELAARLAMSDEAVRVAVHRLRQRYRQLLRDEIAGTVADLGEVEDELRHLRRVLAS